MVRRVAWKDVEELVKREYGLEGVQLMRTLGNVAIEVSEYPEWVEGIEKE